MNCDDCTEEECTSTEGECGCDKVAETPEEYTPPQMKKERPTLSTANKDKVITARVNLYSEHPFFAQLAQYMVPTGSWMVPTAGITASKKLFFNPEFADKLNVKEMTFVIAHETMHLVTATCAREPEGAYPMLWNIATDIAINYLLCNREHGAGMQPPREEVIKILFDGEFVQYDGWAAEDIYYDLLKKHSQDCPYCGKGQKGEDGDKEGDGGGAGDSDGDQQQGGGGEPGENRVGSNTSGPGNSCGCFKGYWWDGSGDALGNPVDEDSMTEEQKGEWKERISAAAESARQAGKLPGALDQFCTTLANPRKNWRRVLRGAANRCLRRRYDWKRVARRTAGRIRTPGRSPHMPEAVVYIDTSGSMSDDDIRQAINEVAAIIKLGGGKGTLILGDWDVYYVGEVTPKSLTNLPVQRGGTNFVPVFEAIKEKKIKPAIFIGFSDLEGQFPECAPNYPVVWCRPEGWKSEAPWGTVIDIEL